MKENTEEVLSTDILNLQALSNEKLHFGHGNAKLSIDIGTFSLPAGTSCPFAKLCKTSVVLVKDHNRVSGYRTKLFRYPVNSSPEDELVVDKLRFRCFAASFEALYANYRNMVIRNKRILTEVCHNDTDKMYHKLDEAIEPLNYDKFRVHVGGDFFSDEYFLAWCLIAQKYKDKIFYTYTKSLPYWVNHLDQVPENFIITASRGGTHDHLIDEYDLKNVQVYFHPDLAKQDGVEIDHDDSLALDPNVKKFGLLLHGSQEKNTNASKCIAQMRKEQIAFGYSRNK